LKARQLENFLRNGYLLFEQNFKDNRQHRYLTKEKGNLSFWLFNYKAPSPMHSCPQCLSLNYRYEKIFSETDPELALISNLDPDLAVKFFFTSLLKPHFTLLCSEEKYLSTHLPVPVPARAFVSVHTCA
jgi:hypothetical protein